MILKAIPSTGLHTSYWRHESDNMHVTLHCLNQTLSTRPGALQRVLGVGYVLECGCREISLQQAVELGFKFPATVSDIYQRSVI